MIKRGLAIGAAASVFLALFCCGGCSKKNTAEMNKQAVEAANKADIKGIEEMHQMEIRMDEIDRLNRDVERPMEQPPEEHPLTR